MASSNHTEHLKLNQWIGSDKPKMHDFNLDNAKIDAAVTAHIQNNRTHVTEQERSGWNRAQPIIGSYTGNAQAERLVELGFQPSFGIVFAVDKNIVQTAGTTGNMLVYSAFISKQGCSQGAYSETTGFTVINTAQAMYNRIPKLNEANVVYVYIVFR